MLLEAIFDVIKMALEFLFSLLPSLDSIQMPTGFFQWFTDILSVSSYFLPVTDFLIMMGIWFAATNFEIIWKTLQRIWDALPFT